MTRELLAVVPEAASVEHIGSTSVAGLASKPTVDVLMVGGDLGVVLGRIGQLRDIGFEHLPGSFPPERAHLFFRRVVDGERTHHLHVVDVGSPEPAEYRLFREYLCAHPDVAARYGAVKVDLAGRYGDDRAPYVAAKEPVVEALLEQAARWVRGER